MLVLKLARVDIITRVFLQLVLLWPDVWQNVHTLPRLSVAAGKSSPPRLARTTLSLLRLRIRVLIISVTIRRLLGKGESQNDTPKRSFQGGFYSERRKEQKPTTINFHSFVTAVDKVANRVKIHHVGTFEIFFCDTCSFSLCRRALPQVSVAW